jgi:hypothetical protein
MVRLTEVEDNVKLDFRRFRRSAVARLARHQKQREKASGTATADRASVDFDCEV